MTGNSRIMSDIDVCRVLIGSGDDLLTVELFAQKVGVTTGTVDGWARRNYVPTVKIGKRLLIDYINLRRYLIDENNGWIPGTGGEFIK